jgi:hypothetical protein
MFGLAIVFTILPAVGCGSGSKVELTSYSDPYFPERFYFSPTQCVYRRDAGGDIHIAAYSSGDRLDHGEAAQQWLHVHIFWNPQPGKTRDNPTSMDAVVRYVIRTAKGPSRYSGTAFAYASESKPGSGLKVSLESGRLHPDQEGSDGLEMLGETRLSGMLYPGADSNGTVDLVRQMDLASGE